MFDIVILCYNNTDMNFYKYAYTNPLFYQLSDQQTLAMNVCRLYAFLMDDRSGEPIRKKILCVPINDSIYIFKKILLKMKVSARNVKK